jgi:hypothetical protein
MLGLAGAVLVLTRPQFLFILPVGAVYVLWALVALHHLRLRLAAVGLLAAIVFAVPTAQSGYNFVFNGAFMRIPFTGYQLLATASYLADPTDMPDVSDTDERAFLESLAARAETRRLTQRHRNPEESVSGHFNSVYNELIGLVIDTYEHECGRPLASPASWLVFDGVTLRASLSLIRARPTRLVRHMAKQIQETSGYLAVLMILMVGIGLATYRRTRWALALAVVAVSALGLSNYVLVGLVEPLATRYTFYTEAVQLPFLVTLLGALIRDIRA